MCRYCRLVEQVDDLASLICSISDLGDELFSLKATIVSLQTNANATLVSASCNHAPSPVSASTESAEGLNSQCTLSVSARVPVFSTHHTSDKRYNIVFLELKNALWVLSDMSAWSQILIMSSTLFLAFTTPSRSTLSRIAFG